MKVYHSVYLEEDKCEGCITCLKRCPTQAIRIRDGKASIKPEFCIDCGECIRRCPHHAKRGRRDFLKDVKGFKYLIALPAPSLYAQFNNITNTNIILTALIDFGFDDVFEVSAGAEIVSALTNEYIKAHPEGCPYISTACPTIERLIRVRFPGLIDHLLPILPPMEVAAIIARERAVKRTGLSPEEIGTVFISPCPSKVTFKHSPLGLSKSNVDAVIATKDIYSELLPYLKDDKDNIRDLSRAGQVGNGWASSGGEVAALDTDSYIAADGIENVISVLEDLEDEKFDPSLVFVELNSCNAGCVGGVFNVENAYMSKSKIHKARHFLPPAKMQLSSLPGDLRDKFFWTDSVSYDPIYNLGPSLIESMANLRNANEILETLPGLDCGICGAPTCRALAEDIVMNPGHASVDDCIHILKRKYLAGREEENYSKENWEDEI